ncbi:hypothetical protein, partial [Klebsiella pneumoniae]|uniref:hypothetical protein n=1 Tax=Klebsiella pneumoniae TaxID=573 RepID=UPI001C6DEE60
KGRDARKRAYCLKIQPATGSFARNLIYSTKPFEKSTFEIVLSQIFSKSDKTPSEALEELYDYSFIGFYKAGGSGYGGSEYVFKYRDSRASFSHASTRFRIHPGLIEVLGLKKV